jgi:hypothetical protein
MDMACSTWPEMSTNGVGIPIAALPTSLGKQILQLELQLVVADVLAAAMTVV